MKLHLPKPLFFAVMACYSAAVSWADTSVTQNTASDANADSTSEVVFSLGDVMYVGDSITNGEDSATYRWELHKILVDNEIDYTEVGINQGNKNGGFGAGAASVREYGGEVFQNIHCGYSSGRAWEVSGRKKASRYNGSNIKNWLGLSDEMAGTTTLYTGATYDPDTFFMLLGTNDLLSDVPNNTLPSNLESITNNLLGEADSVTGKRSGGDIGTIVDAMYEKNDNAVVYMGTIPCWTYHYNNNNADVHQAVATYNESLTQWVADYNKDNGKSIVLVDVNRGLLDVASSTPFYGVSSMFNSADGKSSIVTPDGLHPNSQGDLIIAGNFARAMGIGGRTAGAERKAATEFSFCHQYQFNGDNTGQRLGMGNYSWKGAVTGGYTAELMGFSMGNGALNGWNTEDTFIFTMGNGQSYGSLQINEAYIQWNGTVVFSNDSSVLFSYDMSTLMENIRMAYVVEDTANNIAGGYYVWLGDMLIGEALQGTASTEVNGVQLSYSGSSFYTLQGLAMAYDAAYAPTVGLVNAAPANGCVIVPDNVDWADGAEFTSNGKTRVYANSGDKAGDVWFKLASGTYGAWAGAHGDDGTLDGNVTMIFKNGFVSCNTAFGAVDSTNPKDAVVKGDVTLQFDATSATYGTFTGSPNSASVVGSYEADIGGTFRAVINAGTFNHAIYGGVHTGTKSIGATQIFVNGGTIKGNVYAGNYTANGTIKGNAELIISTLAPFSSHNSSSVLSSGGVAGKILGDAILTFRNVSGSYVGKVSGEGGSANTVSTVQGDSVLKITENSTLTLNTVEDFDSIVIDQGSSLTVNGAITTDTALTYRYDPQTAATKTNNGFDKGVAYGLISGEGSFIAGANATLNNKYAISGLAEDNGVILDISPVYYVMYSPKTNTKENLPAYSFGNNLLAPLDGVVTVGKHNYASGPAATEDANDASAFYVGQHGILCILGDSDTMTAGEILTSTEGSGDIILRSPGYQEDYVEDAYKVTIDSATHVTGNLYLSPIVIEYESATSVAAKQQSGVYLQLDEGADISSFASVLMGHAHTQIIVNGNIDRSADTLGHINNLRLKGSSQTYLFVNEQANEHLILGGDTCLRGYQHDSYGKTFATLGIEMNRNGHVTIENLTTEDELIASNWQLWSTALNFQSLVADKYDSSQSEINAVLDIKSFDFKGYIGIYAEHEGSLHVNLNLLEGQQLKDIQYGRGTASKYVGDQTLTIKGKGTYILSDGNSILDNFGILSLDTDEVSQKRIWSGTVEVNNLIAEGSIGSTKGGLNPADYGNEQSTIHFKGFRGYIFNNMTDFKSISFDQNLILTNTDKLNAFELSNGFGGQKLYFNGAISGTGDFVISMTKGNGSTNEEFYFSGDISKWKANGDETPALIVAKASQKVEFSGNATEINADLLTTGGTMNATISNDAAVTVNGEVSHASGGTLTMTVNTAKGTTFNKTVDINKLVVSSDSVANVAAGASVGEVGIQSRFEDKGAAVLQNGMTIEGNSVTGGSAQNAALTFQTDGSVSSASLKDVSLASLKAAASIELSGVKYAENVYLAGEANFVSLDTQDPFQYVKTIVAYERQYNEVSFSTSSYSGMILDAQMVGDLTLTVTNGIEGWDDAMADALTNVTIKLEGFRVEGMENGERVDKWFEPLHILLSDPAASVDAELAMTVNQLLDVNSYAYVFYEQQADGLVIRMSNIPEPSTATLSLLALAALAARRRRK